MQQQVDEQPPPPVVEQKTPQQLLEELKQKQQEERLKEEERKRLEEESRLKKQQDIRKLDEALKGALSTLSKTSSNTSVAYVKLSLAEKQIQRLFPSILKYKQVRYLDLNTNAISDISIIADFPHLVSLNVSKNQVSDLSCFKGPKLQNVQFLNLSGNKIKVLNQISLPSLRKLNLSENQISSIAQWTGHANLQILQLRKNKLKKLKGLVNLKNLVEIYVCENQITDIRGIQGVPCLNKISFRNNKIKGFLSPFPYMPALKHINLRENQIASLKQLQKIDQHIRSVNFIANPLAEELGENTKRQVIFLLPHFQRINKSDVTIEDRLQFQKQWLEKQAERQKQRLEKQAQEKLQRQAQQEEARKAAESEVKPQQGAQQ